MEDKKLYDMPVNDFQHQIDSINQKLDVILEEIELQRQHRRAMLDLQDDLMRVGKGVYQTTVEELEEVHDYFNTAEALYLGKKLLRNVNNLTRLFEQLESTMDFLNDSAPLSREIIIDFMNRLDEFERKGYFAFLKELSVLMDRIVSNVSAEDIRKAGDHIVTLLQTASKSDLSVPEKISLISLMNELRTPEVKKTLAVTFKFLKNISNQSQQSGENSSIQMKTN